MLINERYSINAQTDFLDSDGFGRVYKALDTSNETTVALKQFLVNNTSERKNLKAKLLRVKALAHPNIVKYLDYFETKSTDSLGREITEQWAVMEYIEGVNLAQFIEKENAETKAKQAKPIFEGIINGLDYLHTRRWDNDKNDWISMIHSNLRPDNILLQYQDNKIIPKICDFGLSQEILESHSIGETNSIAANSTIEYAAPELFNPKLWKNGVIQTNYDYWALGIIIYRYFKNTFPFGSLEQGNTQEQIMAAILDKKPDLNGIPKEWIGLVENCLVKDANTREIDSITPSKLPNPSEEEKILKFVSPLKPLLNVIEPQKRLINIIKNDLIFFLTILATILIVIVVYFGFKKSSDEATVEKIQAIASEPRLKDQYDKIFPFKEGFALVKKKYPIKDSVNSYNRKFGYINIQKKLMWGGLEWDEAYDFSEGFALVYKNHKCGFINKQGELMWGGLVWRVGSSFSEGFASVHNDDKFGFINKNGELMWGGFEWNLASDFSEGFASVNKNNKSGFINKNGELMWGGLEWNIARDFSEGLAPVSINGGTTFGFINLNGKLIKGGYKWDKVCHFSEGFAWVKKGSKCGFINKNGELMWGGLEWDDGSIFSFEGESGFKNGIAFVHKKELSFIIDRNGKVKTP
jgi:serine/threonine protein kinase